jgi:hypothetical protein
MDYGAPRLGKRDFSGAGCFRMIFTPVERSA